MRYTKVQKKERAVLFKALLTALFLLAFLFPNQALAQAPQDKLPVVVINSNHADPASLNTLIAGLSATKHRVYSRVWTTNVKENAQTLKDVLKQAEKETKTSDFCLAEFAGKDPVAKDVLKAVGAQTPCLTTVTMKGGKESRTNMIISSSQDCSISCVSPIVVLSQMAASPTPKPKLIEYYAIVQPGTTPSCMTGIFLPSQSSTSVPGDNFFTTFFGLSSSCPQPVGVAGFSH